MFVNKAYKFRIYPNKDQIIKINQNIGSARFIYNYYLEKKQKQYKENKTNLSLKELKHDLVILKEEYSFLKKCDSMALTNSIEDLDTSFTNFFEGRNSYPKFKKKGVKESYKTDCIRSTYKNKKYSNIIIDLQNKIIKLPKLGNVKIRGYRKLKEFNYYIYNVTMSKEAGRYYISVCVKEEIEEKEFKINNIVGIDLGVKTLVTTSDGIKYEKLDTKRIEAKIENLQRKLSKCQKGSNNSKKIKIKIERCYQKIRNKRKYYIHEITKKIIEENDLIITESLKVKEMIEKKTKHLSKYIAASTFRKIIETFKYKTKWKGKRLMQINTYYPSSQICSHCHNKNKEVKKISIRKWECQKCGFINDRDINASINIMYEGLMLYMKEQYKYTN